MTKPAGSSATGLEIGHDLELSLNYGKKNQLGNAIAGFNDKMFGPAVPDGNEELSLIIRIDQADQVAQDDAVLVTEPRAWQHDGRVPGVGDMNGDAGGHEVGFSWIDMQVFVEAGA